MMKLLVTFAALSLAGSALLSLLPESGLKQTAGLVIGLLTLMCWVEGLARLLGVPADTPPPGSVLTPTSISIESVQHLVISTFSDQQEGTP